MSEEAESLNIFYISSLLIKTSGTSGSYCGNYGNITRKASFISSKLDWNSDEDMKIDSVYFLSPSCFILGLEDDVIDYYLNEFTREDSNLISSIYSS